MTCLDGAEVDALEGWYDPRGVDHRQDRWILHRLNVTIGSVGDYLRGYELGEAQRVIYEFLWGEFCDWYIEMAKVRLRGGDRAPLKVLAHVLERTLRLLHPFMPFITEEVWQALTGRLPNEGGLPASVMVAAYPSVDSGRVDPQAEQEMRTLIQMVRAIRNARAQLKIPAAQPLEASVEANGLRDAVVQESPAIRTLARVEPLRIVDAAADGPTEHSMTLVVDPLVVRLPLAGVVDVSAERARLAKELEECRSNLGRVSGLLGNPNFSGKAPDEVVERERERLRSLQERERRLQEVLSQLAD
jgi:valyl-tRNA synthetase